MFKFVLFRPDLDSGLALPEGTDLDHLEEEAGHRNRNPLRVSTKRRDTDAKASSSAININISIQKEGMVIDLFIFQFKLR